MKATLQRVGRLLRRLHRDERGAGMVEYILIIAAVSLPVLGLLIWFRKDIGNWIGELLEGVKQGEGTAPGDA